MKRAGRSSRLLAWGVVLVAAIFLPWGTSLFSSASRMQSEVSTKVSQVRQLERIETYALRRAGLDVRVRTPGLGAPTERDEVQKAIETLAADATADPALRVELPALRSAFARLDGLDPDQASREDTFAALTALLDAKQEIRERLRADLARCSAVLNSNWKQLNFITILSCALAVTLALALFAYDSSVAARRTVEAEEQELRAELAHVGRLSVVGEMGTKIAHELNQPLGAISGYLGGCVRRLQQRGENNVELIQALEAAAGEAKRASSIIQGLREFARNGEPCVASVAINDLVREVLPLLSFALRESHVAAELQLAEGLEPVLVDRIQIGQVLVNLIRNSLEAMDGTPVSERRLVLRTAGASDRMIEVVVEDTGSGLPEEVLANLFQPFHTTKPKGMGMGLAISRTIVEAHEGWIRAEPRRGQGAIFRFYLPCHSMVVTA